MNSDRGIPSQACSLAPLTELHGGFGRKSPAKREAIGRFRAIQPIPYTMEYVVEPNFISDIAPPCDSFCFADTGTMGSSKWSDIDRITNRAALNFQPPMRNADGDFASGVHLSATRSHSVTMEVWAVLFISGY